MGKILEPGQIKSLLFSSLQWTMWTQFLCNRLIQKHLCGCVSEAYHETVSSAITHPATLFSILPCLTFLSLSLAALGLKPKQTLIVNSCSGSKTKEMKGLAKSSRSSPTWVVNISKNGQRKIHTRGISHRHGSSLVTQRNNQWKESMNSGSRNKLPQERWEMPSRQRSGVHSG